jgi:hypothetical protein
MIDDYTITVDDLKHFRTVLADVLQRLDDIERDIILIDRLVQSSFNGDPVVKENIHNGFNNLREKLDYELSRLLK